ncbi:centrosomal protein of 120 kDa [Chelonus insularis]|uniref:centrosomal protein of 120 kDa n=1 Tax=Chelonus insularis TaxID=460826 RepID=UPI00158A1F74|nr:centrosomal protein of 120 kDa [Chelonus insularis]
MDHLVGPEVQVVLSLKGGKGFNKVTNPTFIAATLNGLSLETDFINPDSCPQYITNLIWEANKSTLRKMRSAQEPLKIECFEIRENGTKDKIGYLLLSLRTAQVIAKDSDEDVKSNWHKLLGLRNDVKADKPEILLSLIIGEKNITDNANLSEKNLTNDEMMDNENISFPYLIPEEHLIQLGPINTCREIFLFSIMTESISNVESLRIKNSKLDINIPYVLWYYILENEVSSKPIPVDSQIFELNEKIVIRIRSSLEELRNYLLFKPYFLVLLKHGESVLGQSEIDLRPLITEENTEKYFKSPDDENIIIHENCVLNDLENTKESHDKEGKPSLNIKLKMRYVGSKSMSCHDPNLRLMEQQLSDIDCHYHNCMTGIHNTKTSTDKIDYLSSNLPPKCTDNLHLYNQVINELETWKENQQELFKLELKRKEEQYLNHLGEEWRKRREYLESKFACNVEQCKELANSLNSATDDLRMRKLHSLQKEARLIKTNDQLKWAYEKKTQELKDTVQKLQDSMSKLSLIEEQKKNLEVQLESVKTENKKLQVALNEKNEELETLKKSLSTQNQTVNYVQEIENLERKLESAQKKQTFFKEQWGKAVREIHKMKMEHRQVVEVQTKTHKDELKNFNLEDILQAGSAALANDKISLGQIQKQIETLRPKSSVERKTRDSLVTPMYDSKSLMNLNKCHCQSRVGELDERLKKLIAERDALLKTGSYTEDDGIIVKLNTEIRSLLINS